MAEASKNNGPDTGESPAPAIRAMPNMGAAVQANLAVLQATNVLGFHFKDLAKQIALPSARYADLLAGVSASKMFAELDTAHEMSTASLAVQTLANSPAWFEATRNLSKSLETQHTFAPSKVLGDVQALDVLPRAAERLAAQQGKLLADANLQFPALSRSLLSEVARPASDTLLGKVADLLKITGVSAAQPLAVQSAASIAARTMTLGLSEQLGLSGSVSSPSWQRLFQDLQLADGLGSVARLAASPGPLLRSQTLASGVGSYASVQRVLSDLAGDRDDTLLRGRSLLAAATLNSYFDSLGTRPWQRRTELAGLVGSATSGLVLGESLTSELREDDAELLVSAATADVIEP